MGNLDTPDSMVILNFDEITLIHVLAAFYVIFNIIFMVIAKMYQCKQDLLYIYSQKNITFHVIQLIKQHLNVTLVIWSIVFRDLMGLMYLLQMVPETVRIKTILIIANKIYMKCNEKFILLIYDMYIIDFWKNNSLNIAHLMSDISRNIITTHMEFSTIFSEENNRRKTKMSFIFNKYHIVKVMWFHILAHGQLEFGNVIIGYDRK
eukprot:242147_1